MTTDADFKRLVRVRMSATGENYTTARQALIDEREASTAFYDKTIRTFFDGETLRSIPARRKPRAVVLLHLLTRFEPGRVYAEPEVNQILGAAHEDHAFLRRELVNYGYLTRGDGRYQVNGQLPERTGALADEVPLIEAALLRAHQRSATGVERPGGTPGGQD
ncbi:DUF2087 domain-containing protein [Actinomycetota bacterium]